MASRFQKVSCLIADDNVAILDALEELLPAAGVPVVGRAETGLEALHLIEARPATMMLLDVRLPDLSGLDVAGLAAEAAPGVALIFYTSHADAKLVRDARDAGVRGVVLKTGSSANLVDAIATVAAGGVYIDPRLRPASLAAHVTDSDPGPD